MIPHLATSSSNGGRHTVVQDYTGTVQQAIYTASTGQWAPPLSLSITTDAKNYTPLALLIDTIDEVYHYPYFFLAQNALC